jgi:hypothetical protein
MRVIIRPEMDKLNAVLLPFGDEAGRYDHMLRRVDAPNVRRVVNFLEKSNVSAYLAGGVVREALLTGKKGYNDIDILGCSHSDAGDELRIEMVKQLKQLEREGNALDLWGRNFSLTMVPDLKYVGGDIAARFLLNQLTDSSQKEIKLHAAIDLIFVSRQQFEKDSLTL